MQNETLRNELPKTVQPLIDIYILAVELALNKFKRESREGHYGRTNMGTKSKKRETFKY